MRVLLTTVPWLALAAGTVAVAQNAPQRLDDPKVNGHPIDHCADIEGSNDCSARGETKAALNACTANGFTS